MHYDRVKILFHANPELIERRGYIKARTESKDRRGRPFTLLTIRLDRGYQDHAFPYPGKTNVKYETTVRESSTEELPDTNFPSAITKRICDCCKKPCYASIPPLIEYDVNGRVICENCADQFVLNSRGFLQKVRSKKGSE